MSHLATIDAYHDLNLGICRRAFKFSVEVAFIRQNLAVRWILNKDDELPHLLRNPFEEGGGLLAAELVSAVEKKQRPRAGRIAREFKNELEKTAFEADRLWQDPRRREQIREWLLRDHDAACEPTAAHPGPPELYGELDQDTPLGEAAWRPIRKLAFDLVMLLPKQLAGWAELGRCAAALMKKPQFLDTDDIEPARRFVELIQPLETHPLIVRSGVLWSRSEFEETVTDHELSYEEWLAPEAGVLIRSIWSAGDGMTSLDVELAQLVRQADPGAIAAILMNTLPNLTVPRVAKPLRVSRATIHRSPAYKNWRGLQKADSRIRRGFRDRDREGGATLDAVDDGPHDNDLD